MHNKPKVSIVIPVYNRPILLIETLNAALSQTYENTEIIIVDNKSTDNTFKIIDEYTKSFSNVFVFQNDSNLGIVRNWRRCVELATGEYIHILWSDDIIAPAFIDKTQSFLENNKDVGFVYTKTEIFNTKTGSKEEVFNIGKTGVYNINLFFTNSLLGNPIKAPVSPANALFRRKDVLNNLLLNIPNNIGIDYSMLGIGNDLLIFLLTGSSYDKFAYIDETLAYFRSHDSSITLTTKRLDVALYYHIAKVYFVNSTNISTKLQRNFNAKSFILKGLFFLLPGYRDKRLYEGIPYDRNNTNYFFIFTYLLSMFIYFLLRLIKRKN